MMMMMIIVIIIISSIAFLLDLGSCLFSFLILHTVGRTP
jgi:hypothetical protein